MPDVNSEQVACQQIAAQFVGYGCLVSDKVNVESFRTNAVLIQTSLGRRGSWRRWKVTGTFEGVVSAILQLATRLRRSILHNAFIGEIAT